jgi:hypothetical protein
VVVSDAWSQSPPLLASRASGLARLPASKLVYYGARSANSGFFFFDIKPASVSKPHCIESFYCDTTCADMTSVMMMELR